MSEERSYGQFCPVARALDVLGDRWTLLIIRELAITGEQRFNELRRTVRGVPPKLLSDRLRLLRQHGLVETGEHPPPEMKTVYRLTDRGREALPVLRELARFGTPLLDPVDPPVPMRPANAVHAFVVAHLDHAASSELHGDVELVVDGQVQVVNAPRVRAAASAPGHDQVVLRVTVGAADLLAVRQGRCALSEVAHFEGDAAAVDAFRRAFGFA